MVERVDIMSENRMRCFRCKFQVDLQWLMSKDNTEKWITKVQLGLRVI